MLPAAPCISLGALRNTVLVKSKLLPRSDKTPIYMLEIATDWSQSDRKVLLPAPPPVHDSWLTRTSPKASRSFPGH